MKNPTHWYISDCGCYLARAHGGGVGRFDVFSLDGSMCWLGSRYRPKGWEDPDPRFTHPEFEHMVGYYAAEPGKGRFRLGWSDHDQQVAIDPGKGNTVIRSYEATFSRRYRMRPAKAMVFDDDGKRVR